jgi:hypothetical protein
VWQWPYSAFGGNQPTGPLQTIVASTGHITLKATKPAMSTTTPAGDVSGQGNQFRRERVSHLLHEVWALYAV